MLFVCFPDGCFVPALLKIFRLFLGLSKVLGIKRFGLCWLTPSRGLGLRLQGSTFWGTVLTKMGWLGRPYSTDTSFRSCGLRRCRLHKALLPAT